MATSFTFRKWERLKSRKLIARLFQEGASIKAYPLKVVWVKLEEASDAPVQFALTVPKRSFPKAVRRNYLRRRIREAYRLHKPDFYEGLSSHSSSSYALMVIYVARETLPYAEIERATKKWMRIFTEKINSSTN